jgi:hypothetical protein
VVNIQADGITVDILYDDGDREYNVAAENYEVTDIEAPEEAL